MEAHARSIKDLFDGGVFYEVPVFQRPYVWNKDEQWGPLWDDVERVADRAVGALLQGHPPEAVGSHFLGSIVVKNTEAALGVLTRFSLIDGQQRIATLQVLLDASRVVLERHGFVLEAETLQALVRNSGKRHEGEPTRFKIRPSRIDRDAFQSAMESGRRGIPGERIVEAHDFFEGEVERWLTGRDEGANPGSPEVRARALEDVLLGRVLLVGITLSVTDDDQLIFETLNDRGTPLLAADLIKNLVFQRGEDLGADTEKWASDYWLEFDDDWWRDEIKQGRLYRSRIDIFLQYWLTMRLREEIPSDAIFRRFRDYAISHFTAVGTAEVFLDAMCRDAATFRGFAELRPDSPMGGFYRRIVEALELGSTTPLLLWLLSKNHNIPERQVEMGLGALESWVVRRTALRMTMKNVNKLMVELLAVLDETAVDQAGVRIASFLAEQTADSRVWPQDDDVIAQLPTTRLYSYIRRSRLRVILEQIERGLRTSLHDNPQLPAGLEIEHVMPQEWRTHWNPAPGLSPETALDRDRLINCIGNLTLVNQKLNASLSNRPWTDSETAKVAPKGDRAGKGKVSLLGDFALLAMTRQLTQEHPDAWTDEDILTRGAEMAATLCRIWPRKGRDRLGRE